jgi:hypothetical protein
MPVRLGRGIFLLTDGEALDDLEAVPVGVVTSIPPVTGNAGCALLEGTFTPRI